MFGKVKRLEAEIQRLEKQIQGYCELQWRNARRIDLLMEHLKVYEHVEPAQPEKREIRKGKKPAPTMESVYGKMNFYDAACGQQNMAAQQSMLSTLGSWARTK